MSEATARVSVRFRSRSRYDTGASVTRPMDHSTIGLAPSNFKLRPRWRCHFTLLYFTFTLEHAQMPTSGRTH